MTQLIGDISVYFYIIGVLGLSVVLTLTAIKFAHWTGFVSRPVACRWNKRTVALGGGSAILIPIVSGVLATKSLLVASLLPPVFVLFALGLFDDIRDVGPWTKLVIQFFAALWIFYFGYHFNFGPLFLMLPISAFWVLVITNSQNTIDNMDGIAAGSAAISALGFALLFASTGGSMDLQVLAWLTMAASLGFLFFNFNPARIFMGDAGSLPLGFIMGLLAISFTQVANGSLLWKLFALTNVLLVPIFDTFVVSIARRVTGRNIMAGGKDHTTHRLVRSGLNERQTAISIYAFAMTGVFLALFTQRLETEWLIVVISIWAACLLYLSRFLWAVPTYEAAIVEGKAQLNALPGWVDMTAHRSIQITSAVSVFFIAHQLVIDPEWKVRLGVLYGAALTAGLTALMISATRLMKKLLKDFRVKFEMTEVGRRPIEVGG